MLTADGCQCFGCHHIQGQTLKENSVTSLKS